MIEDRRGIGAIRRLGLGGVITLIAALALLFSMFQQWYGPAVTVNNNMLILVYLWTGTGTAWQALPLTSLFLALAIAVAISAAVLRFIGSGRKVGVASGAAVCALGILASVLILRGIVFPSEPTAFYGIGTERRLDSAIYFALAAALAIAFGGWRTWRKSST